MEIRKAKEGDSRLLSNLAFRSKGYWPYDSKKLESYRAELEVFEEDIAAGSVYVGIIDSSIIGFYALSADSEKPRLYFMFIEPNCIGKGYGKTLWLHAVSEAKSRGWTKIYLYADAYASEKSYKHQGCYPIGKLESKLGPLIEMCFNLI